MAALHHIYIYIYKSQTWSPLGQNYVRRHWVDTATDMVGSYSAYSMVPGSLARRTRKILVSDAPLAPLPV